MGLTASLILILILTIVFLYGLSKLFAKAGVESWKAYVPVLGQLEWLKILGRPKWWIILLFIPIVNVLLIVALLVETAKAFGRFGWWDPIPAVLTPWAYFPWLAQNNDARYLAPEKRKEIEKTAGKSAAREWVDALLFALVAATFIRMFLFEAYMIPTPSMEKSLLVGDYLFVSKFHYGMRLPNTPLAVPLVHHTIPRLNIKSYLEWMKWPYKRSSGIENIDVGDIIVFNYPKEDFRPVDKRENYIKRCLGAPGDKLEIINGRVRINDEFIEEPEEMMTTYIVRTSNGKKSAKNL